MLIKGRNLTPQQRKQVTQAFLYRWTYDNPHRRRCWSGRSKPTIPLISDDQWIAEHAFHFTADGSRLCHRPKHCEPAYMAD